MGAPIKVRRIDFYPDEWLVGVRSLNMEERAVYFHILALIYSHGGDIPLNPKDIARELHTKSTRVSSIVADLIEKGKLTLTDNRLGNRRASDEIEKAANRIAQNRVNGPKGGRTRQAPEMIPSRSPDDPDISDDSPPGTAGDEQPIIKGTSGYQSIKINTLAEPNGSGVQNPTTTTTTTSTNKEREDAAPAGAGPSGPSLFPDIEAAPASPPAPEKPLFDLGKAVLGQKTGGMIKNLLKHCGNDISRAMDVLNLAKTKSNPREYIGAIVRGEPAAKSDCVLAETDKLYRELGVL